ncbi:MAG: DUF2225 domain-containing protein [Planctomycetota bacterium]
MNATAATISLTCPLCQTRFESAAPGDWSIGEKDTDFCPRYIGSNPLPLLAHCCPTCGFAGHEADFAPFDNERHADKVKRMLTSIEADDASGAGSGSDGVGAVERYRRMALIAIYRNRPSLEVADIYLKAVWCARTAGLPGEDHCRQKAIRYFEMSVAAGDVPAGRRAMVQYLIGELHRRAGNTAKAREWFAKIDATALPAADLWIVVWRDRQLAKMIADDATAG